MRIGDWSSDVGSSDLIDKRHLRLGEAQDGRLAGLRGRTAFAPRGHHARHQRRQGDDGVVDLGFSSRHVALQAGGHQRYGLRHKFSFAGRAPARRRTVGQVEQVQLETSSVSASAMPSPRKTTMTKATRIATMIMRSEEHTSELQYLKRISYADFS